MKKNTVIMPLLLLLILFTGTKTAAARPGPVTYYINAKQGNDRNSGTEAQLAWKSMAALGHTTLQPGDSIRFKRGCIFTGPLEIRYSGHADHYITVTDYGSKKDPAPCFTNPVFREGNYGNCIRVSGSYVVVENLCCRKTAAYIPVNDTGNRWMVWEMGAIHLDENARHCIIRRNEIVDCVAGIRSNGEYALIEHNYIHDCNRVLKQWNWGPIGIWLGADHQDVSYNKIFNYSAVDPRINWGPNGYGSGADGGAFEIDDARADKSDISIHHNYTRDCQGFLEVTWTDAKQNPAYRNFRIHHNISDDYQQFIALWRGEGCQIDHNTIIRRKVNANDWGVFNITQPHSRNTIRDNIIVVEKGMVIFNTGKKGTARPQTHISHNLYYAASGSLNMGKEGPGDAAVFARPLFSNYPHASKATDFVIRGISPVVYAGDGPVHETVFVRGGMPQNDTGSFGAFEYRMDAPTAAVSLLLAKNAKALFDIELPLQPDATQQFAAHELSRYLNVISGAMFAVHAGERGPGPSIVMQTDKDLPEEDYRILATQKKLVLSGGSGRALLYAVYDLLHRLGCVWAAPQFSYYNGSAEYVPHNAEPRYQGPGMLYEHPRFAFRKLDVEEGRSHTIENLKQIIEWMPKMRLNDLMVPINYQGAGRVQWDNWREALSPELKKRGILVEVGGHGYQNFLNAKMEKGSLFSKHPDWFGKNKKGEPAATDNLVFNTANPQAVKYFITNIINYLRERPEIDIFDCWPPDVAKWAECPETEALGPAVDRQARLMNQVDSAIKTLRPGLRLEIIAYGQVLLPPVEPALNKNILVDICPINQSFEKQIYEPGATNTAYAKAIHDWRQSFAGDIGLYSYFRKYAWRSLPNIITHFMQKEMQWYNAVPLQGISTYAEPGDWYSYELNHYTLAHLAWNPAAPVDSITSEFMRVRYGSSRQTALAAYQVLETVVRNYCSIPYTTLKPAAEIAGAETKLRNSLREVHAVAGSTKNKVVADHLHKLEYMLQYAADDLGILQMRTSGAAATLVEDKVKQLVNFMEPRNKEGVFILPGENNTDRFLKHYNGIQ